MENSDGLFTVICDCGSVFSPEVNKTCPKCSNSLGKLVLDIDKFLIKVTSFEAEDRKEDAIDMIFDVFFNLWNKYDIMNSILDKIDVSKLSGGSLCSILTNTFKYSEQIPNHVIFFQKVSDEYIRRGKTPEQVKKILVGLQGAGNHWEYMEQLGATGYIWGPNPNKK